jgi:hypothetical protein
VDDAWRTFVVQTGREAQTAGTVERSSETAHRQEDQAMHPLHPDHQLDVFKVNHRLDIAAAERRRMVRAHATATASPTPVAAWLRRAWGGLVGARPRGAAAGLVGRRSDEANPNLGAIGPE